MAVRLFLGFSALAFLPYGIFCLVQPSFLGEAAGVVSGSTTGTIELRAMYGGLQAGLGVLAGLAVFRAELVRPALIALGFLCSGPFMARLLGVGLSGELSGYTASALAFEMAMAALAIRFVSRSDGGSQAA